MAMHSFCCAPSLMTGVRTMARLLPLLSILIVFYTFGLEDQIEIGLCLSYACFNLAVNIALLVGIQKPNCVYFIPWMSWTLLCITLSVTFAPVMIYVGIHVQYQVLAEGGRTRNVDSVRFITYGVLLLFKAAFFGYLWVGVFTMFKQLRRLESGNPAAAAAVTTEEGTAVETSPLTAVQSQTADHSEEVVPQGPARSWVSPGEADDPPPYLTAVKNATKYIFEEQESPPDYFDAIVIGSKCEEHK